MSTPTMTGPLTGGAHGFPFGSPSAQEVERRGYVMEEFLLAGTARSYEAVSGTVAERDGRWRVHVASTKPYVTRLYVVRPADPRRFNGVVVVNWQNVTLGIDLGAPFGGPGAFGDEISRGYAWVGVTTQELAVTGVARDRGFPGLPARTVGLREWDPQRYGTLQHPGDAFSYDIFSQAGRLVKVGPSASGVDPLGGLRPRMVLATGGSQSATRLTSYINAAHPVERVYDGFLLLFHWGLHQPLVEQDHFAMFVPAAAGGYAGSCRIRDDGGVPVLVQSSECEHPTSVAARQPDSPTYRHWEIAGASHAPFQPPPPGAPAAASSAAQGPMPNAINWTYLLDSALRSLVRWVDRKQPPASQSRIETEHGAIGRDRFGNARGGIRVPELEAPTANYRGRNDAAPTTPLGAPSIFTIMGTTTPLADDVLRSLYPSREAYVRQWDTAVDALVASGLLLAEDVDALRGRGRAVRLPTA